ncbi:MAG TPA: substrate-binding domain-containing protein [Roseiflexaceae bacterium]|nr:substrate-binding domain-containing protein [Roseiflexaceae bacterium]
MPSLLGILSVEQYHSFFAERYFREILTVASQTISGHDCYIRIMPPLPAQADSAAAYRQLAAQGLDAALVIAPDEAFLGLLEQTLALLPSVIISSPRLDIPWSYANSDNYGALREIVAHLAGLGRQKIRLLQPTQPTGDYLERARGYLDAISALGLDPSIGEIDYPIDATVIERQALVGAPDALIAPDDHDALALLSGLQRRGLRVPEDIALVGFDDEDFTAETFPTLTTVSQPLAEMSRHAVQYLLDRLAGVERGVYQDILPNRLIVRESSGARQG